MNRTHDTPPARAYPPVADLPDRACNGADTRIFFPTTGGSPKEALDLCARCPHRQPCLDWALKTGQTHGIWGGTGPDERYRIHQARLEGNETA